MPAAHYCDCRLLMVVAGLGLVAATTAAQNQPSPSPRTIVGRVESISGNVVYVQTGNQVVALYADERTEVWKGKVFHGLSPVVDGDYIISRCRTEGSGKLLSEAMWLNIVNFSGVITRVADDGFTVFTNPNADPQSAYKKENKKVTVNEGTVFESSAEADLKPGRGVQIVGLDLRNGRILATRVTVYEGNNPVRMGSGKIILPNGQLR